MQRYLTATTLVFAAGVAPAWAEITAQEAWQATVDAIVDSGGEIEATVVTTADGLSISDILISSDLDDETTEGSIAIAMDSVVLTEDGDGGVLIDYPEVAVIAVVAEDETGAYEVTVDLTLDNVETYVAGTPDAMLYTYAGDGLRATMSELLVDGDVVPPSVARFDGLFGAFEGATEIIESGGITTTAQDFALADIAYDMAFPDPEEGSTIAAQGTLASLSMVSASDVPDDVDFEDLPAAVNAGFAFEFALEMGAGESSGTYTEASGAQTSFASNSGAANMGMSMSGDAVALSVSASALSQSYTMADLPVPIEVDMNEVGLAISVPTAPTDEPTTAEAALVIDGLAVSDFVWNMFDPAELLPRAPASVALDLVAEVTPLISAFDVAAVARVSPQSPPALLHTLTLGTLVIDAAGALVTGEGAFSFDNTDLQTLPGFPRPEGAIDLELSGINGLIDTLIQMGLLPQEQAMGARMFLAMLTVPGAEPDTATSRIEFNSQGHLLANGQRLPFP